MGERIEWPGLCGGPAENTTESHGIFWDHNLTLNTHSPDLTECFQLTLLLWIPCGALWLGSALYIPYLCSQPTVRKGWRSRSKIHLTKLVCGASLTVLALLELLYLLLNRTSHVYPPSLYISFAIIICTYVLATIVSDLEHRKDFHTSGVLLTFWFFYLLQAIVFFRSRILKALKEGIEDRFFFSLFYVRFAFVLAEFIVHMLCDYGAKSVKSHDKREEYSGHKSEELERLMDVKYADSREQCPEERASFLSNITHWWIAPLIIKGFRRPLKFSDLYKLTEENRCERLVPGFNRHLNKNIRSFRCLMFSLIRAAKGPILVSGIGAMLNLILVLSSPILLRELITFVTSGDPYAWKGYFLAIILVLTKIIYAVAQHVSLKYGHLAGQRMRSILMFTVYSKALRLSHGARKDTTVGQIVNLMSVDAQKVQQLMFDFHQFWACPLMLVLTMYLLWTVVGPASMAGLAVIAFFAPLNGTMARFFSRIQIKILKFKDTRIKLLNEVLSGIKVLKFYAWESSFMKKICDIREKELKFVGRAAVLNLVYGISAFGAPYLMSLAVFATYILSREDKTLPPEVAFVALNIMHLVQVATSYVPILLGFGVQSYVSLMRIHKMFNQEEIDPNSVAQNPDIGAVIQIEKGSFSWGEEEKVLKNIDMRIETGKLVAVVGQVGCGKSSLLNAILGEMKKTEGQVYRQGTTAYVPQQAWIQNKSMKENILFGKAFDPALYDEVLETCALKPDLEVLPAGDATEIGEKGINLSGGQKQRVNLARAVYQDCDIYLLDDVMSAVDAHVGKHIFRHVIGPTGLLKHKTRILVTHSVSYLPEMDYIIALKDGCIAESGTYQELVERNGAFSEFISNYLQEGDDAEEADAEQTADYSLRRQPSRESGQQEADSDAASPGQGRQRKGSTVRSRTTSEKEQATDEKEKARKLVDEEQEDVGRVKPRVIWSYIRAAGLPVSILLVIATLVNIASMVASKIWLSQWSDDQLTTNITDPGALTNQRLGVYGAIGVAQMTSFVLMSGAVFYGGILASRALHNSLIDRILQAPMSFFDTTPLGRIINRFSSDMQRVDDLPDPVRDWVGNFAACVTTLICIVYSTPIFLVAVLPIGFLYILTLRLYIPTVRQIRRMESVRKSPIFMHFDETLVGVSTVRAFERESEFRIKNQRLVDDNQSAFYPMMVVDRWFAFNMEALGALIVLTATLIVILQRDSLTGGLAGLAISFALASTNDIYHVVRSAAVLETATVAIERTREYSEVKTEAPRIIPEHRPSDNWPEEGAVKLSDFSTRYRKDLDPVLKKISVEITPGEKVGIVGRTGAGKSSLTLSLFRIIEAAGGAITIDGINIADIGLHDLRSKLTIIPQDPVLFSGSLRMNLDPFDKYIDDEIWTALDHAHLKSFVTSLPAGLQHECGEGGSSLSVGQRQLVCLARALLRKSRVLILDEATAAVDMETDDLIQATIRQEFKSCTVITIAHRINTILDYDRIMVMADGQVVEYDTPTALLTNQTSVFHDMAEQVGLV